MPSWIAWALALFSTAAFLVLWFWEVHRILQSRRSIVESAQMQLSMSQRKAEVDFDAAQICKRSEGIYLQAVQHYNNILYKPWIYLPAMLMGFRPF